MNLRVHLLKPLLDKYICGDIDGSVEATMVSSLRFFPNQGTYTQLTNCPGVLGTLGAFCNMECVSPQQSYG